MNGVKRVHETSEGTINSPKGVHKKSSNNGCILKVHIFQEAESLRMRERYIGR
jgi:hypothetical protein